MHQLSLKSSSQWTIVSPCLWRAGPIMAAIWCDVGGARRGASGALTSSA
jgi:hypothetical protein